MNSSPEIEKPLVSHAVVEEVRELEELHRHLNDDHEHRMPWSKFFIVNAFQMSAVIGLFYLIAPSILKDEIGKPWAIVGTVLAFGVPLSLFEYLYHRYLLHSAVLPFLGVMHQCHSTHHGLTYVKAPVSGKDPDKFVVVDNAYPIEEDHQEESMMFPLFAISVFYGIFLLILGIPVKLLLPGVPAISATIVATTIVYAGYEIWHAILHLPFERFWRPAMEHRTWGKLMRHTYGFHLMHHWRPTTNLAIFGCWGIALWDYVFRTHRRPENMPLNKAMVNFHDAKISKPLWPISMLDKWQPAMYKGSRKIEKFFARVFMPKPTASK